MALNEKGNHYLVFESKTTVRYFYAPWAVVEKYTKSKGVMAKRFANTKDIKAYIKEKKKKVVNPELLAEASKKRSINKYKTLEEAKVFRGVPKGLQNEVRDFEGDFSVVPDELLYKIRRAKTYWLTKYNEKTKEVTCLCKVCGKKYKFKDARITTHKCIAGRSEYEKRVHAVLQEASIPYVVEFDTLACLAPDTGMRTPYDIQLKGKKILIEIQGEQHLSYIPGMHANEEEFKRRVALDKHKLAYAESRGYKVLYLYPDDLRNAYKIRNGLMREMKRNGIKSLK